jgi:recombination protein RecA
MPRPKKSSADTKTLKVAGNALAKARDFVQRKMAKSYEQAHVVLDPEALQESAPHLPTGSTVIDFLIGGDLNTFGVAPCPGLPRGRVTQVWGHESAGKTTLALSAAAAACADGGTVVYIDWENDIVPDYAAALGVPITDPEKFELLQPDSLEDGIKFALVYAAAGVDLIVFDSVGAAVPRRIAERDLSEAAEQSKIGELQSIWSQELPNLKSIVAKSGTAVLGISQVRADIGVTYGPKTKPQGGNAWKFYSSVRLELRRVRNEQARRHDALTHKTDDRVIGGIIKVKAVKCKMSSSQGREALFYIRWGEGIDNHRSILEIAMAHGLIKKGGAWISWDRAGEVVKKQGVEKMRDYLIANPDAYNDLCSAVYPLLGATDVPDTYEDEDATGEIDEALAEVLS